MNSADSAAACHLSPPGRGVWGGAKGGFCRALSGGPHRATQMCFVSRGFTLRCSPENLGPAAECPPCLG